MKHQPLSFAAAIADTGVKANDFQTTRCRFTWDELVIESKAGKMNYALIKRVFDQDYDKTYMHPSRFEKRFRDWLTANKVVLPITIAGKNPQFDAGFLSALGFNDYRIQYLDPSMFYVEHSDDGVPGLSTCLRRMGITDTTGVHDEMFDVLAVVKLIQNFYQGK